MNNAFYTTELEASLQLCMMVHIFISKDFDNLIDFLFNYTTRYQQFK